MGRSGTATATVLFAHVSDPTQHPLVEAVIDDHAGRVLESDTDGMMAVFDATSDAIAASVSIQQRVSTTSPETSVRVGIAAGDVSWDDDDCFGLPVVVATRLENAADAGQVVVSAVVRLMAGDRAGVTFRKLGPLTLSGIDDPVDAFEVHCTDAGLDRPVWRFPPTLPLSDRVFVGRTAEMAELRAAWSRVSAGGSEMVLIGGDAGGGKTRLATEAAREFHAAGALVLSGLNDSELALPYQPWLMILDQVLGLLPQPAVHARRDDLASLRVLHPRIDRQVAGLPRPETVDPETQRHHLLSGLASVLGAATALAPTVVVLDDLHWAGAQTLDVLRFLARANPVPNLLVVGTFRDTSDEIDEPLRATLADLRRLGTVNRLKLTGLDLESVLELVAANRAGDDRDLDRLALVISQRTGGNPFLVSELCAHLDEPGGGVVPESVVEVVSARLHRLSPPARRVAEVMAIGANRLGLRVLADAAALDDTAAAAAVSELMASGLVDEVPGPATEYQYAHALLRDAVAALSSGPEHLPVHLALAEAIERAYEVDRRVVLPHLARHFAAAAAIGGREKAIYYGRRAAAQARQTAAYEEGVSVLQTVLDSVPGAGPSQVEIAMELMDLLQRSGRHLESGIVGREAFRDAQELGDIALQTAVALQYERVGNLTGGGDPLVEQMLEVAIEAADDAGLRLRLRSALCRARSLAGRPEAREEMEEVLHEARELGDDDALTLALEASLFAGLDLAADLASSRELQERQANRDDPWSTMWATGNRVRVLVRAGRLTEAASVLEDHRELAARYRFFLFQFMSEVLDSILAMIDGRFDDAERFAAHAEDIGLSDDISDSGVYGLLMFTIRREQGRLEEMRPVLELISKLDQRVGLWSPGLALAAAELGFEDDARASFAAVADDDFAAIPRDSVWPAALSFLAETAIILGDREAAAALLAELEPFGGQALVAGFTTCLGPADRLRAGLSELAGNHAEADRCIESARDLAVRSGSPTWRARVEHTHAWILAQRDDTDGATHHFALASALAEPIGMRSILDHPPGPLSEQAAVVATTTLPDRLSPREADVLALVAEGCSNRDIAAELLISPNTAANHVRSILQKSGCANRTEAAAYAVRVGITRDND